KSRLCRELRTNAEAYGARVLRGRSLSYGESTGYGAFAEIVRKWAGILDTDRMADAREKLVQRVPTLTAVDADAATDALTVVTGLGPGEVENRNALFDATRSFVEAIGREQPTVVGFEDLHWAEP